MVLGTNSCSAGSASPMSGTGSGDFSLVMRLTALFLGAMECSEVEDLKRGEGKCGGGKIVETLTLGEKLAAGKIADQFE